MPTVYSTCRTLITVLLTASALVFALPSFAAADVNNFTITNFTADYYLSGDDPQGALHVIEKINVQFTGQNHGILRALPKTYHNLPLDIQINTVTSDSGAPATYVTTSDSNDNEVIKIGDPTQTVTGAQEYTLDYTMQHVINFQPDHDELYWNVNGTEWDQTFTHVQATLHLPDGLHFSGQAVCYQGPAGSRDQRSCHIDQQETGLTVQAGPVYARDTLTFVAAFPKGSFQSPTRLDYVLAYLLLALEVGVPILLFGIAGFVWWWLHGRDPKGSGVIVPQYDAPDSLSPLEVGTLLHFKTNDRDYTATIISLAIRQYLQIIETNGHILAIKTKSFRLRILRTDWSELNNYEKQIMEALLGGADGTPMTSPPLAGSAAQPTAQTSMMTVDLSKPNAAMVKTVPVIKKAVDRSLTDRGYFASNPYWYMAAPLMVVLIAIAVLAGQFAFLGGAVTVGAMLFAVFYHFMPARTGKGVTAKEHILGLKRYLEVTEKDRLEKLQSPDAPYVERTAAPSQTVELFEELLPYAIVLQVEKQWATQFAQLYTTPPSWYAGNFTAFNAVYLAGSLSSDFSNAMTTSFGRASSSSGFGGGAGGGGGGGGGGGW